MGFDRTGGSIGPFDENMESKKNIRIQYSLVGEAFFSTLGISILKGREFNAQDRSYINPVAVVNQALAATLFPGEDPIGKYMNFGASDAYQIVGLAANVANENLGRMDQPFLYVPLGRRFGHGLVFVMRTSQSPAEVLPAIKAAIQHADPVIALNSFSTMDEAIALFMLPVRILATLCGALGLLALVLAVIGIYGVVSYSVNLRRQEIGVRLALGAKPLGLMWLLARGGMGLILLGCVIGLVIALGAAPFIGDLFQGVNPTDPLIFVGTPLLLAAVAFAALILPTGRAVRSNPMKVLRYE
jgi:ABC-type antimicrobial peptide transport system permease subunit